MGLLQQRPLATAEPVEAKGREPVEAKGLVEETGPELAGRMELALS